MTALTDKCSRTFDASPVRVPASLKQLFIDWFSNQQLMGRLAQERRQLAELSDARLKDMGISRYQAETEAQRRDIPASRCI